MTPLDALIGINFLNNSSISAAEGEGLIEATDTIPAIPSPHIPVTEALTKPRSAMSEPASEVRDTLQLPAFEAIEEARTRMPARRLAGIESVLEELALDISQVWRFDEAEIEPSLL